MHIKVLEVRDALTFIPVIAICVAGKDDFERYLVAKAGYGLTFDEQKEFVLMSPLVGGFSNRIEYDHHKWEDQRTLGNAHKYIREKFWGLQTGEVIDIEFILGEKSEPKKSQRTEKS
jgi:hypothetical protein